MSDDDTIQPPPKPHRALAIALAVLAIGCLAFSAFSPRWLATATGNPEVGLRTNHACRMTSVNGPDELVCDVETNRELIDGLVATNTEHVSTVFPILGWALTVLIAIAVLGLVIATVLAIAGKRPDVPVAPTTLALLGALLGLITGCIFIATKPYEGGYLGVQIGFWAFGVGAVCALTASMLLANVIRPADVDLNAESIREGDF